MFGVCFFGTVLLWFFVKKIKSRQCAELIYVGFHLLTVCLSGFILLVRFIYRNRRYIHACKASGYPEKILGL